MLGLTKQSIMQLEGKTGRGVMFPAAMALVEEEADFEADELENRFGGDHNSKLL